MNKNHAFLQMENLKEIRKFDHIFKNFQKKLNRSKKYFLKKLRNFFEHQYRFKISLRIEWEHSQPLKITLKHSNLHPMKPYEEPCGLAPLKKTNATCKTNLEALYAF